jgi:N6-adenosine-specific RNA methylase IME4
VRYRTIVADPPWRYTKNPPPKGKGGRFPLTNGGGASAEDHYPTMTTDAMQDIDVAGLAADDAHLYCWVTNPVLLRQRPEIMGHISAPAVVRAWGFEPMALLTWHKTGPPGMGFYFRGQTEHVIFAIRGKAPIPPAARLRNLFESPRRGHSEKPELFLDLVEQVSPAPRIELFARRQRFGWDTWGDEALNHVDLGDAA